ncbi:S-layer homology domain-containing protein [Coleofasciculus sp. FACHB-1120]|uniref:S-layer homology domain-containing protein n=1 Tax=Coleofasciculus sp. FACHB-1120 TaxID=2692783 RepID=UPI00168559A8|nr:S-layer homology domain-containing protein [Coleofasciculus sp. FACHB-1120]MBD2742876.1 S-layer homology domain-containing protein [Coleofasciculus sp. FACHB-1120]
MTNSPPPDPRSSRLGFDELIGIVVAFSVIGTIFFWSIGRREPGVNLGGLPTPDATASPTPAAPLPAVIPGESRPQQTLPTPSASPNDPNRTLVIPNDPDTVSRSIPIIPVPVVPAPSPAPSAAPATVPAPAPSAPVAVVPVPAPTASAPAKPINFSDIPDNYWARPYIQALVERNILAGFTDGTFRPDQPITRAEFTAPLRKAFGQKPAQNAVNFQDVPAGYWAEAGIKQAVATGFLKGYPRNRFLPNQEIPRAQVLVALASGLGLKPPSNPAQALQTYQDASEIPKYAIQGVAASTAAGLVINYPYPNLLKPNQAATRAEVAAAIYQALVQAGQAEPIPSPTVVPQQ